MAARTASPITTRSPLESSPRDGRRGGVRRRGLCLTIIDLRGRGRRRALVGPFEDRSGLVRRERQLGGDHHRPTRVAGGGEAGRGVEREEPGLSRERRRRDHHIDLEGVPVVCCPASDHRLSVTLDEDDLDLRQRLSEIPLPCRRRTRVVAVVSEPAPRHGDRATSADGTAARIRWMDPGTRRQPVPAREEADHSAGPPQRRRRRTTRLLRSRGDPRRRGTGLGAEGTRRLRPSVVLGG